MRIHETRSPLFWVGRCWRTLLSDLSITFCFIPCTRTHPNPVSGIQCWVRGYEYTRMATTTLPSERLFQRVITPDPNVRAVPFAKLRPNLNCILAPIQEYMAVRDGQEQTYRCSLKVEKEYKNKVAPVKYDSPLNDYIRHVPFFRRSEVFPYYSSSGNSRQFLSWPDLITRSNR